MRCRMIGIRHNDERNARPRPGGGASRAHPVAAVHGRGWREVAVRRFLVSAAAAGCLAAALAGGARPAHAQNAPGIRFGIQPAGVSSTDAGKGAYFSYTLAPGAEVKDSAIVMNTGQSALALKLYAADGLTAIGGGTAFGEPAERRFGVLSWLSASNDVVWVAPGQRLVVPFKVHVPADATAGDHVAGWVIEAPPKPGGVGDVQTSVTQRAGVAVVVRVPGEMTDELAIADLCLNQESGSNYVQVSIANMGNALTKATGELALANRGGQEIAKVPFDVGTVLPADGTYVRVALPLDPGSGDYVAAATLRQADGRETHGESQVKITGTKANACAAISEVSPATAVAQRGPASASAGYQDGGGVSKLTIGFAGVAALFGALFLLSLGGRKRRRKTSRE